MQASFVCLYIHLLGAGGLQIVGLSLCLLLLHALAVPDGVAQLGEPEGQSGRCFLGGFTAIVFATAAGASLWLGVIPVNSAARNVSLATILRFHERVEAAVNACEAGIAADPLATDSRQRMMEILTYEFLEAVSRCADSEHRSPELMEEVRQLYEKAVVACDDAIAADQRSLQGFYFRSRLAVQLNELQPSETLRRIALKDMQRVIDLYPTNSSYWLELAELQFDFGRKTQSRVSAARALEIDSVNHEWGHIDRYLDSDRLAGLKEISDSQ